MKIYLFLFLSFAYWGLNLPAAKYQVEDFKGSVMIDHRAAVRGQVFNSLANIDLQSCNSFLQVKNLLTNKTIKFNGNCISKKISSSFSNAGSHVKLPTFTTDSPSTSINVLKVNITGADQSELEEYYQTHPKPDPVDWFFPKKLLDKN